MHDPKIVEAMARAMHDRAGWNNWERTEHEWRERATAALTALCTLHPGVAALLSGEAVAVPRGNLRRLARTAEMSAGIMRDTRRTGKWEGAERVARQFDRMGDAAKEMLASPWAREEKRDEQS